MSRAQVARRSEESVASCVRLPKGGACEFVCVCGARAMLQICLRRVFTEWESHVCFQNNTPLPIPCTAARCNQRPLTRLQSADICTPTTPHEATTWNSSTSLWSFAMHQCRVVASRTAAGCTDSLCNSRTQPCTERVARPLPPHRHNKTTVATEWLIVVRSSSLKQPH